jgi:hypothetical protein
MQKYQIINSLNFTLFYLNIIFILSSFIFYPQKHPTKLQTHKGEGEKKCEGKYKNIKNGVEKGFCSTNMGRGLTSPKMEKEIESLMKLAFCKI